jgi:hypothetical protein
MWMIAGHVHRIMVEDAVAHAVVMAAEGRAQRREKTSSSE